MGKRTNITLLIAIMITTLMVIPVSATEVTADDSINDVVSADLFYDDFKDQEVTADETYEVSADNDEVTADEVQTIDNDNNGGSDSKEKDIGVNDTPITDIVRSYSSSGSGSSNVADSMPQDVLQVGDNVWAKVLCDPTNGDITVDIYGTGKMWDNINSAVTYNLKYDINELLNGTKEYKERDSYLFNVRIEEGVTSVGNNAFSLCSWEICNISLPSTILSIGEYAFDRAQIKNIILPASLQRIGNNAFSGCSFSDLVIPGSVKNVDGFNGCKVNNLVLNEGVESIEEDAFLFSTIKGITLPSSLKSIKDSAFSNADLNTIDLPDGLSNIGSYAFCRSTLATIQIPGSVKQIGEWAFASCEQLNSIELKEGIQYIGSKAFAYTPIVEAKLPKSIKEGCLDTGSFEGCGKLVTVIFEGNIKTLPDYTFGDCNSLKSVTFKEGLTKIGKYAFASCGLENFIVPDTVEIIDDGAFSNNYGLECKLKSITLSESLKRIGYQAFYECKYLSEIKIKAVELIDSDSFSRCTALKTIKIPYGCHTIGWNAFEDSGLKSIYIPSTVRYTGNSLGYEEVKKNYDWVNDWNEVRKNDTNVDVYGVTGSCAELWANNYGYHFIPTQDENTNSEYKIDYSLNGGTNNDLNVPGFDKNNAAITLYPATRDGYTFTGWYTDEACKKIIKSIPKNANKDYTLYAGWKPTVYKITYKLILSGASNPNSKKTTYQITDDDYVLKNATKAGEAFLGWYTDAAYTNKIEKIPSGSFGNLTLYAKWRTAKYTVRYDGNGASSGIAQDTVHDYKMGESYLSDGGSLYRKGYHIAYWNTKSNGKGSKYLPGAKNNTLSSKDGDVVTLYAQWTANTYTVKYDANGGGAVTTGKTNNSNLVYDKPAKLQGCGFKRDGYMFAGWNTQADQRGSAFTTAEKVQNLTEINKGTVTLYAMWTPIKYQIEFIKGEKSVTGSMDKITATYDTPIKLPRNGFARTGYRFGFWRTVSKYNGKYWYYADEASDICPNFIKTNNGKMQLQPVWVYTYSLCPNGGTGAEIAIQAEADVSTALPANTFSRTGYTFGGWSLTPDGKAKYKDKASIKNLADTKLYAVWTPIVYKITYKPVLSGVTNPNSGKTTYRITDGEYIFKNAVKAGNAFLGWYTDAAYTNKIEKIPSGSYGNLTLYAKWRTAKYTVRYDGNGASSGIAQDTVHDYKMGESYLSNGGSLYRKGYHIAYWNTKSNGKGSKYLPGAKNNTLSSKDGDVVTLYAQWAANTYTVKYDANAGGAAVTGKTNNTSHIFDKPAKLQNCGFKRDGYLFAGWNTKAGLGGLELSPNGLVQNLTEENKGTVTLYAMWTPIKYQIEFVKGEKSVTGSMDKITATYDTAIKLPRNGFARTGYRFGFWRTVSKYNGKYWYYADEASDFCPNFIKTNNGKMQLQPVWVYTFTLCPNGGTGDETTIQAEADVAKTLPANTFSRTGYTFGGWSLTPNGKRVYADKGNVKNIPNQKLYAIWTPQNYDIYVHQDGTTKKKATVAAGKSYDLSKLQQAIIGKHFIGWSALRGMTQQWDNVNSVITLDDSFIDQYAIGKNIAVKPQYEDIRFTTSNINVNPDETKTIDMNNYLNFSVAGISGYKWSSSNTSVAAFNNKEKDSEITLLSDGETTVTLSWNYGKNNIAIKLLSNSLARKISNFEKDPQWMNGISWGENQPPKISKHPCKSCMAYAADFTKYVYGIDNPQDGQAYTDQSEIRTGDTIMLSGHWCVILDRQGDTFRTAEGNYSGTVNIGINQYKYDEKSGKFQNDYGAVFYTGYHYND